MNPQLLQNYSKRKFTIPEMGSLRKYVKTSIRGIHVGLVGRKSFTNPFHYLKKIEFEVKGLETASSSASQSSEVCTIVT